MRKPARTKYVLRISLAALVVACCGAMGSAAACGGTIQVVGENGGDASPGGDSGIPRPDGPSGGPGAWQFQSKFTATDVQPEDRFGSVIAATAKYFFAASRARHDDGRSDTAVYIFEPLGVMSEEGKGTWLATQRLFLDAGDESNVDHDVMDIAVHGNVALILVAPSTGPQRVQVVQHDGALWRLRGSLPQSIPPGTRLERVSYDGARALIASLDGKVTIHTGTPENWREEFNAQVGGDLRPDIQISGQRAMVVEMSIATSRRVAHIYEYETTGWHETATVSLPGNGLPNDASTVAMVGDWLLVQAPPSGSPCSGVKAYRRNSSGGWPFVRDLIDSAPEGARCRTDWHPSTDGRNLAVTSTRPGGYLDIVRFRLDGNDWLETSSWSFEPGIFDYYAEILPTALAGDFLFMSSPEDYGRDEVGGKVRVFGTFGDRLQQEPSIRSMSDVWMLGVSVSANDERALLVGRNFAQVQERRDGHWMKAAHLSTPAEDPMAHTKPSFESGIILSDSTVVLASRNGSRGSAGESPFLQIFERSRDGSYAAPILLSHPVVPNSIWRGLPIAGDGNIVATVYHVETSEPSPQRSIATIFERTGSGWSATKSIEAEDTFLDGANGNATLSLSRDRLLFGGIGSKTLGVYERTRDGEWTEGAPIVPNLDGSHERARILSASLDGDRVAFLISDDEALTRVDVLDRVDGRWMERARFILPTIREDAPTVGLRGDVLAVGQPGGSGNLVRIYERVDGQWREKEPLKPYNAKASAAFGSSLAIGKDTLWIGASRDGDSPRDYGGAIYLFER